LLVDDLSGYEDTAAHLDNLFHPIHYLFKNGFSFPGFQLLVDDLFGYQGIAAHLMTCFTQFTTFSARHFSLRLPDACG